MVQRRKYALLKQPFELDALGDISLTNPVLGDVLYYDGSFWINTPYAELVDDRVAALLVAGNNIDITYNDGAGTITIDVEALSTADLTDASSIAMLNQTEVITGFWTFTDYVQIDSATGASFWFQTSGAALNEKWWGFDGSTGGDFTLQLCADNGTGYKTAIKFTRGSGAVLAGVDYGNATDNPAHTFYGAVTINGNVTLGTDNVLTFDEHATAPGTPAAGKVVVYAKADGKLYIKDDAGTETDLTATGGGGGGNVATDTIWDAKGDLAVGTGADTSSKLSVGANDSLLVADSAESTGLRWGEGMRVLAPSDGWYIEDDFFITPTQATAGPWPWDAYANGTSAAVTEVQGESNAPGILRFTTGTQSSGQATATYGTNDATIAHRPLIVGGGEIVVEARVRVSAVADGTNQYFARIGLVDELSGAPGDGIYFGTVGSSGVWQYTCRATAASATFTNDAGSLAISTSWQHIKLVINAAGTSVEFFVDGVSKATVTTNIPATGMTLGVGIQKNAGTTSRDLDIDYIRAYQKFTTARW